MFIKLYKKNFVAVWPAVQAINGSPKFSDHTPENLWCSCGNSSRTSEVFDWPHRSLNWSFEAPSTQTSAAWPPVFGCTIRKIKRSTWPEPRVPRIKFFSASCSIFSVLCYFSPACQCNKIPIPFGPSRRSDLEVGRYPRLHLCIECGGELAARERCAVYTGAQDITFEAEPRDSRIMKRIKNPCKGAGGTLRTTYLQYNPCVYSRFLLRADGPGCPRCCPSSGGPSDDTLHAGMESERNSTSHFRCLRLICEQCADMKLNSPRRAGA